MKTHPILFQAEMVRALLAGTKTQTRRILKQPNRKDGAKLLPELLQEIGIGAACPYGKPGDLLWVRETFAECKTWNAGTDPRFGGSPEGYFSDAFFLYAADGTLDHRPVRKKPSIHMPRRASRLTLEITDVRVQRVQEISHEDALSEGCPINCDGTPSGWYRHLWESINGGGSWAENPWIWALTFKVHHQNVDEFLKGKTA